MLRVFLGIGLQFRVHKNLTIENVRKDKNRVRKLASTRALTPGLVRNIEVAAVQTLAL